MKELIIHKIVGFATQNGEEYVKINPAFKTTHEPLFILFYHTRHIYDDNFSHFTFNHNYVIVDENSTVVANVIPYNHANPVKFAIANIETPELETQKYKIVKAIEDYLVEG